METSLADFEYAFTSSGTPTSLTTGASGITGVVEAGTSAPIGGDLVANVTLLITATKTDAELVTLMQTFIQRHSAGHEGAGGYPTQASLQRAPALSNVGAAD